MHTHNYTHTSEPAADGARDDEATVGADHLLLQHRPDEVLTVFFWGGGGQGEGIDECEYLYIYKNTDLKDVPAPRGRCSRASPTEEFYVCALMIGHLTRHTHANTHLHS